MKTEQRNLPLKTRFKCFVARHMLVIFTAVNAAICSSIWFSHIDGNFHTYDDEVLFKSLIMLSSVSMAFSLALLHRTKVLKSQMAAKLNIDSLTGLPDRVIFNTSLENKIKEASKDPKHKSVAALIMDLNGFKQVNDTLGHPVGDKVLKVVADKLRSVCREQDTVCRLGGDEFGLAFELNSSKEVEILCSRILCLFSESFSLDGQTIDIGISIGVSFYPVHSTDVVDLIRYSDIAMYEAKNKKLGYSVYNEALDHNTIEALEMVSALKFAIDNGQLVLDYQLKKDLKTEDYTGAEALVRWNHPTLGVLSPDEFIPVAEESGLITPLTDWVLHRAIDDYCMIRETGLNLDTVSINISPYCVSTGDILVTVTSGLTNKAISAKNLIFEVTETSIQHKPEHLLKVLVCLDMLGITLSIDDFGTGQSSLMYLKHLPIKEIKVDRSFVSGMGESKQDLKIVQSTIDLAHSVGCSVVAEGVETKEVEELLRTMGCDVVQGYYISRPIRLELLIEKLKERSDERRSDFRQLILKPD